MEPKPQKIRMADIAKLAGVSYSAVSAVLSKSGRGKIRVGKAARERICRIAEELHYQPNMAASILAGGSSKLIGVFIDSFSSYRTMRLLQEIEKVSSSLGYRIITSFTHDNISHMKEDYLMLQRYGVAGFICCAHDYPDLKDEVAELFAGAKNVVFMEKPPVPDMPYVRTSRVKAMTMMIADACRKGYRRFGAVHRYHTALSERTLREEFIQALRSNNLSPDENLIFESPKSTDDPKSRLGLAMEKMILPFRPDFLFIDDAVSAATLWNMLSRAGMDIAVYGGNNDPLFADIDLKSLDPCYKKIAAALLDLLLHPECRTEIPLIEAVYRN